ncbi:MAG: SigB/SigF/SigG family RNA polymerase sigma factor [Thermocrispum sp.]
MTASEPDEGRRRRSRDYDHLRPLFDKLAGMAEDDPRRAEVRAELITGHLPLATHIAQRFAGRGTPKDDLVQVATIGLINAVDRFRPDKGSEFLAFAVPTVTGEIRRYFRDSGWSMRVPRRLKELHLSVSSAASRLAQRLGRAPTPSELVAELDITKEEVFQGIEAGRAYSTMSLDEPLGSATEREAIPLGEVLGTDDEHLAEADDHAAIAPLILELPERERQILALRFFHDLTQTEIADRVGVSQMHVSRLLGRALAKVRRGAGDPPSG